MTNSSVAEPPVSSTISAIIDSPDQNFVSPIISSLLLIINTFLTIPMGYLHYLIASMIKRDKNKKGHTLIGSVLRVYTIIVPFTFFAMVLYANILLNYVDPPSGVLGEWFCHIFQPWSQFSGMYIGQFSLVLSMMKYWFVVKSIKAKRFGEKKATVIFLVVHLVVPILASGLILITDVSEDAAGALGKCYWVKGRMHEQPKSNIKQIDFLEQAADYLCFNHKYDSWSGTVNGLKSLLRFICGGLRLFKLVVFGNVIEILLYIWIFKHVNRYL